MTPHKARRRAQTLRSTLRQDLSAWSKSVWLQNNICLRTVSLCAASTLGSLLQFANFGATKKTKNQSSPSRCLPSCLVARLGCGCGCSGTIQQRLYWGGSLRCIFGFPSLTPVILFSFIKMFIRELSTWLPSPFNLLSPFWTTAGFHLWSLTSEKFKREKRRSGF